MKLTALKESDLGMAVDLAQADWRDLLMVADFAWSTEAQNRWFESVMQ